MELTHAVHVAQAASKQKDECIYLHSLKSWSSRMGFYVVW